MAAKKTTKVDDLEAQLKGVLSAMALEGYTINWLKLWQQSGQPFPTPSGDLAQRVEAFKGATAKDPKGVNLVDAAKLMIELDNANSIFDTEAKILYNLWDGMRKNVLPPAMEAQDQAKGFKNDVIGSVILIPELYTSIRTNVDGKKDTPRWVIATESPVVPGVTNADPVTYVEVDGPGAYLIKWERGNPVLSSVTKGQKLPKGAAMHEAMTAQDVAFQWLTDRGFGSLVKPSVNGQSLKSTLKGVIEKKEHSIPAALFKLTPETYAKITQPKGK